MPGTRQTCSRPTVPARGRSCRCPRSSSSSRRPTSRARCTSVTRWSWPLEDAMVRRARMIGHATLWLPGVDHARSRRRWCSTVPSPRKGRAGRASAASATWSACGSSWTPPATSSLEQHRRLGASADWSRQRFTMDAGSAQAVRSAFKRLYDDGLAYRDEQLINWCPGCQTSLSDLEVVAKPQSGTIWSVRYHLVRAGWLASIRTEASRSPRHAPRPSSATRRWRSTRRPAIPGAGR